MAEVKLTVLGEDKLEPVRKGLLDTEKILGYVKSAVVALGISFGAKTVVDYAKDATLLNARYKTLGVTMTVVGNNAGYTSAQMAEYEKTLRKTGIAAVESRENLTVMAQANIDLAKASQLARIAQDAAVIGNINSSEAFSRMIYGIQSGQIEVLRTIGLNVNFEQSYQKLAKQQNKSAESLTELEKIQARTNVVMEKGKDINGAYEAAMGTSGKMMNSLKRYLDDLKVTLGSTFSDALLIAVTQITGGLKSLNDEAGQLQQSGQLEAWGKDVVYTMALSADFIRYLVISAQSASFEIYAIANSTAYLLEAAEKGLSGNFNGASQALSMMKSEFMQIQGFLGEKWSADSYYDTASKIYAQREADIAQGKRESAIAEKRRIDLGKASKKQAEEQEKQAQITKKAIAEVAGQVDKYAKSVQTLGQNQLEMAKNGFTEDLQRQQTLLNANMLAAGSLEAPLRSYLGVIGEVYGKQLDMQTAIGQALFRIGADQQKIAAQNVTIASTEKAQTEARLNAWSSYLANLQTMHAATLDSMKRKQQELFDIKLKTGDLVLQIQQGMMTPMERYYSTVASLEQKSTLAMGLASDEKIKMLGEVQQQWASLASEIKEGDKVLLSQVDASEAAINRIRAIGSAMETEKETQLATAASSLAMLEQSMQAATGMIEQYRQKTLELDATIAGLTRTFDLTLVDQATPVIDKVRAGLDMIRDKTITINTVYTSSYASDSYSLPSYDVGTPYVPKTGIALIHKGERIITAADNAKGNYGGSGVTIGAVNFNLPNISNQSSADDLVNQAFPKLAAKLDEYQRRKRAA